MTASLIWMGLVNTLVLWSGALLLGAIIAIPVTAARRSANKLLAFVAAAFITVIRGIPPLMWLFIIYFALSVGGTKLTTTFSAILGLGIVSSGYLAEIYRAGINSVPRGHVEAVHALGVSDFIAMRKVVLPECMPVILGSAGSYSINLIKDTALASLIGSQELSYFAADQVQRGGNGLIIFTLVGVVYLVISVPVGFLAKLANQNAVKLVSS